MPIAAYRAYSEATSHLYDEVVRVDLYPVVEGDVPDGLLERRGGGLRDIALRHLDKRLRQLPLSGVDGVEHQRLLGIGEAKAERDRDDGVEEAIAAASPARREKLSRIALERVVVRDRQVEAIEWVPAVRPFFKDSGCAPRGLGDRPAVI